METDYSVDVIKRLEKEFESTDLFRPMRVQRFDAGTELTYEVTGVATADTASIRLVIEKFVGGGFAGQVYRVRVLEVTDMENPIAGLEPDSVLAMKILIPTGGFARFFRNALYWIGFQGPFQLQVNPSAARAGALWQKFIRRGAKIRLGDEKAVVDIYATFADNRLGSCGELSEWIEGRTWWLEVDEHMDLLKKWRRGKIETADNLGSPEYRSKYQFMTGFVGLLHEMGAHEFARQYEWSTCKSQPNCLKRHSSRKDPMQGLVAVDFRAGLALLPYLPMSPGDFKLIFKGLSRGSLVQFDRGDTKKLERFVHKHKDEFADMIPMLEELKAAERMYRNSVPDITHNHIRLLYSGELWSTMLNSAVIGWQTRNIIDEDFQKKLQGKKTPVLLFTLLGFIPFFGRVLRKSWGHSSWRKHYRGLLTSWSYFRRSLRAKIIEKMIGWYRDGRIDEKQVQKITQNMWKNLYHLPLSVLPAGLHRFLTDGQYARERLSYLLIRPVRLYFNADLRAEWLREMVIEGKNKHLLSDDDADLILGQVEEPFIQKYLKSLAVHLCTLPVTQIISVMLAGIYIATHPEMPRAQAYAIGLGIVALFQVVPISPGSLTRGLYVLILVIRERNVRDYNIALYLSFFKYIGYLAFPIQMAYRYPALARFMAGHWATEAVHIVPVFGERGALLEHWVFCLFYNWPLTIQRRMRNRAVRRAALRPRYWHIMPLVIFAAGIFGTTDWFHLQAHGLLPELKDIWWLIVAVPALCGIGVTVWARGASMPGRIIAGVVCGLSVGILYTAVSAGLASAAGIETHGLVSTGVWRIFIFAIFTTLSLLFTEVQLPE